MKIVAILATLVALFTVARPNLRAQTPAREEKEDPFFNGPPFSRDDLLERIAVIADRRLRAAVLRRGISFSPSPEDYENFKKAGATAELLQTIAAKAPPPPAPPAPPVSPEPPPPVEPTPPPVAGVLTLKCAPADCNVTINGKPHGATANGSLQVEQLPPGNTVVDFIRNGFESQEISIALEEGKPESRSVTLTPTAATQEQTAKELLAKMIATLGGADALRDAAQVSGSGNASLWQSGGQRTEWRMIVRIKLPTMAMMEINGAGLKWWTSLAESDSKADGSKQIKGGPVAVEMEKLVRLYRDYQPARLASRLEKMKLTAPDVTPDLAGTSKLVATDAEGSLTVLLGPDFAPMRVTYESASGLGSGLEILYSGYMAVGKARYPKSMTIKFADQAQHGLEVRLDSVSFETNLTNRDFHR